MTTGRTASPSEQTRRQRELARFIGQIQTLTVELKNLRQRGSPTQARNHNCHATRSGSVAA